MAKLFKKRVSELPDAVALREKDFGIWNEYTWRDYGEKVRHCGLGLKALGLERGDVCSVASEVCKEWLFADLGIVCVGGITNGVYPTDAPNQVEYLINDSDSKFYFAEDEEQLDKVLEVRETTPTLRKIIIFDMEGLRHLDDAMCMSFDALLALGRKFEAREPEFWAQEVDRSTANEVLTLTYTSGTTGKPKGAMIEHRNMMYMVRTLQRIYGIEASDNQIGFLPLAHIAGKMFYTFSPLESLSVINLVESLETVNQDMQELSPTIHFAVPRVWEKMYSTVIIKLKDATAIGRTVYEFAINLGERMAKHRVAGTRPPKTLSVLHAIVDRLVLKNVRVLLGIDRARWLSTAAAPISPELIEWFWALGRPMYEVYGQTECTGLATANAKDAQQIGSVGKACAEAEVRLSDDREILIRSPGVISGYWKQPEKTAETVRDGWLHTGDVGDIDDNGFVYIRDRMKDIIITAGGKNVTPSEIENQMKFSPFISDAVVVGDRRPYLTCLVMIDHENVTKFAQDKNVPFPNYASLCQAREVQELIGSIIEEVNKKFARVETVKKFRLIDQLLDPEDDELTPTMKLKRKVVNEKYSDLIEEMY
ncbi:MAG: AMP-dependent synthetase/ligase [Woeseiaceae bacterium]